MSLSMYQASVPVFVRMLTNLSTILDKGQAHADARKFDSVVFLGLRLTVDMLPLSRQVQIACDAAKLCCSRISGVDAPKFDDKEASIAELKTRIASTIAYLKSVTPDALDGTEDKNVTLKLGGEDVTFKAQAYLLNFAHPNLYFHVTTAYNILRQNGVEIGKMDYIGPR
jgi:hypothetical protein